MMNLRPHSHRAASAVGLSALVAAFVSREQTLLLTPAGVRRLDDGYPDGECLAEGAAQDATSVLAAAADLLTTQRGRRVRIVLSDLWVRTCLIQVDAAQSLNDAELLALARGQMSHQHPETTAWTMRVAMQGNALIATVSQPDVTDGLRELADDSGVRLGGIEPLFPHLWDRSLRRSGMQDGWLLLEEPGLIMVVWVRDGGIVTLHSSRQDGQAGAVASSLLERQAALLGIPAGDVRLFSCAIHPLALAAPWRVGELVRY